MAKVVDLLEYKFGGRDNTRAAFSSLDRSLARTESRAERLKRKFAGLGAGIGKLGRVFGGVGAIAGGLSLAAGLRSARREMGELDALAKQISTSGLSSDLFQTLQFATEEASISQERLNGATLKFTAGIGELRGGFGTLTTSLKALNPELATQLKLAGSNDEAFLLFADAVKNAKNQSEALALVSAVTGKRGAEMFRVFNLGREGLAATGETARGLGNILDKDLLARAEKLENRFGVAAFTIDRSFKTALIDLAPVIVTTIEGLSGIVRWLGNGVEKLQTWTKWVRLGGEEFRAQMKFDEFLQPQFAAIDRLAAAGQKVAATNKLAGNSTIEWTTKIEDAKPQIDKLSGASNAFGATASSAFANAVTGGEKLGDTLKGLGKQLASQALQKGFGLLLNFAFPGAGAVGGGLLGGIAKLFGFADGGSFKVGGSGGTDSQLVAFKASPDETVSVTKPGQQSVTPVIINFGAQSAFVDEHRRLIETINAATANGYRIKTA